MSEHRCRICGRPVRDPVSVDTGVGPSCATKRTPREMLFRAAYFAEEISGVLVIFDRDCGSMSVTNDADRILPEEHRARGGLPAVVIYRDSDGRYDRLRHRNGVFGGFAPIGATSLAEALAKIREPNRA